MYVEPMNGWTLVRVTVLDTSRSPGPKVTSMVNMLLGRTCGPVGAEANQVMVGLGTPSATHVKETLPGDTTDWSMGLEVIVGPTGER